MLGVSYSITTEDIVSQVNDQRGKNGLAPLSLNGQLNVAAQLKGQDMLAKGYWAHVSPDGKEPWYFILQAGYNYNRAGENLAKDFRDSTSTVNAWMASPGHRANILNTHYTDTGVAVVSGPFNGYDTVIIVQMFGEPLGGSTVAAVRTPVKTPVPAIPKSLTANLQAPEQAAAANDQVPSSASSGLTAPQQLTPLETQHQNQAMIDPIQVTKIIVFVIGMFFIILLGIDAYMVSKQRIRRDKHGHSLLHAIFLGVIMLSLFIIETGVIL